MSKRLSIRRTSILLILLLTCSPVTYPSTKNNPPIQKAPQKASDDIQIDPDLFALKQLLYCDSKLELWFRLLPGSSKQRIDNPQLNASGASSEEYEHIVEAASLVKNGNPKQAITSLESNANEKLKKEFDYWLVLGYAKQQAGDIVGARSSLHQILALPDMDTSVYIQAWGWLRDLGDKPEKQIANKVLGVVVEVGTSGTVIVVGGFEDGLSRLWFVTGGGGTIGGKEYFPKESITAAKKMVSVAQPLVSTFPLEKDRQLPKQGRIRFALLTPGGIHVKEESIDQLNNNSSASLAPINSAAHELFTILLKFTLDKKKKQ